MRKVDPFFVDGDQVAFLQSTDDGKSFVILEVDDIYALTADQAADFGQWLTLAAAYIQWANANNRRPKQQVYRDYVDEVDDL